MNNTLKKILIFLKSHKITPSNIEIAQISNMFFVSSYNFLNSEFISESIASGASYEKDIALIKSLTEYIERMLSKEVSNQFKSMGVYRSDGFAAFPNDSENLDIAKICSHNAFHEAYERYCWANWWDNSDYSFTIQEQLHFSSAKNLFFYNYLIKNFDLEKLLYISPTTNLVHQSKTIIIFAKIRNYGYVSGGAADFVENTNSIVTRAFSELTRHLIAFQKMKVSPSKKFTFYENRLFNFACGQNNFIVEKRLSASGNKILLLPDLAFNDSFQHRFANDFILHRCLFKNQPIFMGGDINRLCI